MLNLDPNNRITAQEALEHSWISNYVNNTINDDPILGAALNRLGRFRASNKLQKSFLVFIASQILGQNEEKELIKLFKELDTNGDGKLSYQELEQGYKYLNLSSKDQIQEIITNCDSDKSGYIDFTEFITAATNWNLVCQKEQLQNAFSTYDHSNDGFLSIEELKNSMPGIEESE